MTLILICASVCQWKAPESQGKTGAVILMGMCTEKRVDNVCFLSLSCGQGMNRKGFEEQLYGCELSVSIACGVHSGWVCGTCLLTGDYLIIWAQFLILQRK